MQRFRLRRGGGTEGMGKGSLSKKGPRLGWGRAGGVGRVRGVKKERDDRRVKEPGRLR